MKCDIDLSEEQIKETLFPFFGVRLFCPFPKKLYVRQKASNQIWQYCLMHLVIG